MAAPRIGLLGGAFDPPHRAHVALAESAVQALHLDHLLVLPTGQSWHRSGAGSAGDHRLAMARLAFADVERTQVLDLELKRQGPSYTIDTVRDLQAQRPGHDWFLIMGEDQWKTLPAWHQAAELVALVTIAVAVRDASVPLWTDAAASGDALTTPVRLPMPRLDVSATLVRSRVAQGQAIDALVPEGVCRYIHEHHLYA